jgi:endo-1,4-beta-xylanase
MEQHVTELDISIYSSSSDVEVTTPTRAQLAAQANRYRDLFNAFGSRPSVTSVTTWGVHDAQSWLNNFPVTGRDDHPLLFDRSVAPKAALWAVADPTFVIPT